jgi:hypothetical protein
MKYAGAGQLEGALDCIAGAAILLMTGEAEAGSAGHAPRNLSLPKTPEGVFAP